MLRNAASLQLYVVASLSLATGSANYENINAQLRVSTTDVCVQPAGGHDGPC